MSLHTATEIAKAIYANQGYDPLGDSKDHREVFFGAFEFEEKDAFFLAGPFQYHGKCYGLVSVRTAKELEPIETITSRFYAKMTTPNSTSYMPYTARQRVAARYEKSDFFFDAVTEQSYSDLDLQHGADEIDPAVKERLKQTGKCGIFFNTKGALQVVCNLLTSSEINDWQNKLKDNAQKVCEEVRKTTSCVERPYEIYLYGTDDCSFTITVTSEANWKKFLSDMKTSDFVHEHMVFTN